MKFSSSRLVEIVDVSRLEQEAGVGVEVTKEQIVDTVKTVLEKNRSELESKGLVLAIAVIRLYIFRLFRSRINIGPIVKQALSSLRFADAKLVRLEVETQLQDMLSRLTISEKVNWIWCNS